VSIRIPRSIETPRKVSTPSAARNRHPHFAPDALTFLRQLARNNRREWFNPRKDFFLERLRQPMLALVAALLDDMADYAPNFLRPPEKCVMRIYRDTRFSHDKTPYKKNVAAWFAAGGLEKTSGGGFYLHVSAKELVIAAGLYMPDREQLTKVRHHLLDHHAEFRKLLNAPAIKRNFTRFEGLELTRAPKGFDPEHPAMDLIRCRQWGIAATLPPEIATTDALFKEVSRRFRLAAPLVHFLNTPLLAQTRETKQPKAFRL
jgi:uncharacterized protein (TIGR02453 family)